MHFLTILCRPYHEVSWKRAYSFTGLWHEKVDQHNTGSIQYERIERHIVEHTSGDAAQSSSDDTVRDETTTKAPSDRQPPTRPGSWSA